MMAMFHCTVKTLGRNKGCAVVHSAAYRHAKIFHDDYYGETYDYTYKRGIMHTEILLPPNAPLEFTDSQTLWNSVEKAERYKSSRLAREVEISLPVELSTEEQITLVREYVLDNFVAIGMCADIAIHDKGDGNPHTHIMLTTRNVTHDGFCKKKNRDWDKRSYVTLWREQWARIQNREFEKRGLRTRVSHDSYFLQGIDKEPTRHLGRKRNARERQGYSTDIGNDNRAIATRNKERELQLRERKQQRTRER
jgi:ATP-dependent exoDNAse (exonuclease V) alpha subunit